MYPNRGMALKILCLLLTVLAEVEVNPVVEVFPQKINCLECHNVDKTKLSVHLIPHSHDDVGWLKTLDQYYYGLNSSIQQAGVQYIITSVVDALLENPERRFIQVETAFFWKWWNDQSAPFRNKFKSLVETGQIEMVNGAWSMNDEACTNYQSTVDQFTWGLRLISDTVGTCGVPRVGWQIDPFGHSREHASLLNQMGYDGVFFARMDHDDKDTRQNESALDWAWQTSANLDDSTILGSLFATSIYNAPDGFCWDVLCNDDPIDDDVDSPDYNVDKKVQNFSAIVKLYRQYYRTNNVALPMGEDFQFSGAESNFINMDRLIKAFKNNTDIDVFYSTPSCYINALHSEQPKLPLKVDDFFPYSNDNHSFWTGYFTSRPNSKRFERTGHNILQVTKQLYSFASLKNKKNYDAYLRYLREAMGTLQHHDAITGTEKQHVARDYVRRLHRGVVKAEEQIGAALNDLLGLKDPNVTYKFSSCLLTNISICSVSQNSDKMLVMVYNPLAWSVTHYVRLPVDNNTFVVTGPNGIVDYDLVPVLKDFSFVNVSGEKPGSFDLVFGASNMPAIGLQIYHVEKTGKKAESIVEPAGGNGELTLGFDDAGFTVDLNTNLLKSLTIDKKLLNIEQNFFYYHSLVRNNSVDPVSGAYLFRPNGTSPLPLGDKVAKIRAFEGKVVKEFHQRWSGSVADVIQSIRVYKGDGHVEFDWIVGNIELGDNRTGHEIITRYSVADAFGNNGTFYTDSNGREMIKRVLNYRPDYSYNASVEPVASNYYPVTSKIVIADEKRDLELAILNDRPQGGSSLNEGEIELMVHRRLFQDDNKGVGEPLNETEFGLGIYARGSHYLIFGKANNSAENQTTTAAKERSLAQKKLLQPWLGLAATELSYENLGELKNVSLSGLSAELAENVNILTFEPWINDTYILRLEHIFEKGEDLRLSSPVTVSLQNLFNNFTIEELSETTLGANVLLETYDKQFKYKWNVDGAPMNTVKPVKDESKFNISLTPMQIRTFIVKLSDTKPNGNSGVAAEPLVLLVGMVVAFALIT